MSGSQVFLFGSFTEDEAKSLLKPSPEKTKKPVEKKELPVGSPALSFGSFDSEQCIKSDSLTELKVSHPSQKPNESKQKSDKTTSNLLSAASQKPKESTQKGEKTTNNLLPEASVSHKENGYSHKHNSGHPLSNGKEETGIVDSVNLASLHISTSESSPPNESRFSKLQALNDDGPIEVLDKGKAPVEASFEELTQKAFNGPTFTGKDLLPHGLINSGNLCFLNATLQALLPCSPFVQLLQRLRSRQIQKAGYPTLSAFTDFVADFDLPADRSSKTSNVNVIETGKPFKPTMFEEVLKKFTPDVPNSLSGRPRQEDAQEFLSFILHQMHDELLKLGGQMSNSGGGNSSLISSPEDDEWETVGRKNKSAVTRTQDFAPSELSAIFGGQICSTVKSRGNTASATVQPFLLLHLDISHEAVRSIEDALHLFSASETLEEYRTSSSGKAGVSARKAINLQTLPKIMVLHLMRFSYGSRGSTKLHKPIRFPFELVLGRELLVSPSTKGRRYELVSSITHHGREASKGHYTADARYPSGWIRFDDSSVTSIARNKVLHDQAYVLFYKQVSAV